MTANDQVLIIIGVPIAAVTADILIKRVQYCSLRRELRGSITDNLRSLRQELQALIARID
jgi:hypothetical protein